MFSCSVVSDSLDTMDCTCQAPLSVHGVSPGRNTGVGCMNPPGNLPNPGIEPISPALQVDSLPSEPLGKPKNTRVGSLSLLQGIFLTQELKQDLLHCRHILYQLSYQGSPIHCLYVPQLLYPLYIYVPILY